MREQEALDKLSLYAKSSWDYSLDHLRDIGKCTEKLQKLIDKQDKKMPFQIPLSIGKTFFYCGNCRNKLAKKQKYCCRCGTKIDW